MNKLDIIKEIKHRLELYKTIKPEEFNFGWFVFKSNPEKDCGTVCCLWGWEPKLTKVIEWEYFPHNLAKITVSKGPYEVLKWGEGVINYLYYDSYDTDLSEEVSGIVGIELNTNSSLPKVLSAWERVIELLETGDSLDKFLNLR